MKISKREHFCDLILMGPMGKYHRYCTTYHINIQRMSENLNQSFGMWLQCNGSPLEDVLSVSFDTNLQCKNDQGSKLFKHYFILGHTLMELVPVTAWDNSQSRKFISLWLTQKGSSWQLWKNISYT